MAQAHITRDSYAGLFFSLCGLFFVYFGADLDRGTASEMGTGYFPVLLGWILTVLGIAILLKGTFFSPAEKGPVFHFDVRGILIICASVLGFAALLDTLGLFVCMSLMVALSTFAARRPPMKEILGLIVIINLLIGFIFIFALDMNVPVWPAFIA